MSTTPITIVFFGKSGAGKGTQSELLIKKLGEVDPDNRTIFIETGNEMRKLKASGTYTGELTKAVIDRGGLMPPSVPIWAWSNMLINEVKTGKEHIIFDGVSRQPEEAPILDSALQFYDRGLPFIILLDVHHDEATKRLLKRGRHDDKHEKIKERLSWFETNVMPAVNHFKKSKTCRFLLINGDQSIEKVHEDIVKAIGIA